MGKERFSERQTAVLNAAARLDEVAALPETDIVRDAAIQRFEFTFELVWKTLQLYLEHEGFEAAGPRAVLKRAFVIRLISDQDEGGGFRLCLAGGFQPGPRWPLCVHRSYLATPAGRNL